MTNSTKNEKLNELQDRIAVLEHDLRAEREKVEQLRKQRDSCSENLAHCKQEVERLREALKNIEMNTPNSVIRDIAEGALDGGGDTYD